MHEVNKAREQATLDDLRKCRSFMLLAHPFFGQLAMNLRLKVAEGIHQWIIPTAATDGVYIVVNPDFWDSLSKQEKVFLVAHQTFHCALDHIARTGEREPDKWNVACDYVINLILSKQRSMTMPQGGLLDSKYEGMNADTVYKMLPDPPPPEQGSGAEGDDEGSADEDGQGQGGPGQPGKGKGKPSNKGGYGKALGDNKDILPAGSVGKPSDTTNNHRDDDAGLTPQQLGEVLRDKWKGALAGAYHAAKSAGDVPAGVEELINDFLHPRIDWKDILRRFFTEQAMDDYNWMSPDRYMLNHGFYLPTLDSEGKMGEMAVFVDTSGSIGPEELKVFGGIISNILEEVRPSTCHVFYGDTQLQRHDTFDADELPITLHKVGGGGTAFSSIFHSVAEMRLDIHCAIFLTDLYVHDFGPEPKYPVLWASTTDQDKVPWGQVMKVDMDDLRSQGF